MLRLTFAALAASLSMTGTVLAQLLPAPLLAPLPAQLPAQLPERLPGPLPGPVTDTGALAGIVPRLAALRQLVTSHPKVLDVDASGSPIVRGEVLAIAPSAPALERAAQAGFVVARQTALEELGLQIITLTIPAGMPARRALKRQRRLAPAGHNDFNHVYTHAGHLASAPPPAGLLTDGAPGSRASAGRVGLVDGGVNLTHPALSHAAIRPWGCEGANVPNPHGTAVASLLVGKAPGFSGVAPSATLYAADVYCGEPAGGNVLTLAAAFAWLAGEGVPVINVSLVGPPDTTLERVIRRLLERGVLVVAAVGNDGPAAPPLFPAAYPGVIGVTGVDARQRVLIEAGRGPQVSVAAPGADMAAASGAAGFSAVRGTSFAAPLVAGLLAQEIGIVGPAEARTHLASIAVDLGRRGRDDIYGDGLVGDRYRVAPDGLSLPVTPGP